jgi:hypothetical protein
MGLRTNRVLLHKNARMTGFVALPTKSSLPINSATCPQIGSWATVEMAERQAAENLQTPFLRGKSEVATIL